MCVYLRMIWVVKPPRRDELIQLWAERQCIGLSLTPTEAILIGVAGTRHRQPSEIMDMYERRILELVHPDICPPHIKVLLQEFRTRAMDVVRIITDQASLVEAAIRANLQHWQVYGAPMPPDTTRPPDRFWEAWKKAVLADAG